MSPHKRRFSNLIVFSIVVVLVIIVSSAVYFFKIQKNEDYQNQLHFRELNTVAHSVRSSIEQFSRLGKTITTLLERKDAGSSTDNLNDVVNRARNTPALARLQPIVDSTTLKQYKQKSGISADAASLTGVFTTPDYRTVYIGPPAEISVGVEATKDDALVRHAIEVATADLLPDQVLSFPIVILAGGEGQLVAKKVYLDNSTYAADLEFHSVKKLLHELYNKQTANAEDKALPSYSGTLDKEIAGINYRIFVQPITLSLRDEETVTYYLLGMAPLAEMQIAKLSVSPGSGLWIFVILLTLSALIPILKIRFMSSRSHFTKTDISLFFTGCALLLGMLTITVNHQLFFSHLVDTKQAQARAFLQTIIKEFDNEVTKVTDLKNKAIAEFNLPLSALLKEDFSTPPSLCALVSEESSENKNFKILCEEQSNTISTSFAKVSPNKMRALKEEEIWSVNQTGVDLRYDSPHYLDKQVIGDLFAESAFKLDYRGLIPLYDSKKLGILKEDLTRLPILRISESSYNFTDFSLSHREYFKMAITCQLWFASKEDSQNCKNGVYIQRIKNVSDARLSTQFSYADFESLSLSKLPVEKREVVSLSVKLNTFFERIMPKGFGYAVFDDQGEVLYHSDESRALLENILVETNNDEHIRALIAKSNHSHSQDSVSFNTMYRNAEHLFVASGLSEKVPWHIVVFINVDDISEHNLWMLLVAVVLFVQLMLVLLLWNRFIGNQLIWSNILSFRVLQSEKRRSRCATEHYHQINFGATATLVFSATIALLLMMSSIVDLSMRLSLWSLFASLLLLTFCAKMRILPSRALLWTHPVMSFFLLFLCSAFISIGTYSEYSLNDDTTSLQTTAAGLFILSIGIIVYATAHTQFFAQKWLITPFAKVSKALLRLPFFKPAAESKRFSTKFVVYMTSLLWFFAVVPAAMFINSSNHYLLGFQAHQESEHIRQRIDEYEDRRLKYLQLIRPELNHIVNVNAYDMLPAILIPEEIYRNGKNVSSSQLEKDNNKQNTNLNEACTSNEKVSCIPALNNCSKQSSFIEFCAANKNAGNEHEQENKMYVDSLINTLMSQQAFGASLNQDLFQFAQLEHKATMLNYDGNKFLREAVKQRPYLVALSMLLTLIITFKFSRQVIVQRVMGEHIPDNFMLSISDNTANWQKRLEELARDHSPFKAVIIRTDESLALSRITKASKLPIFKDAVIDINKVLVQQNDRFILVNKLKALQSEEVGSKVGSTQQCVLVLKGLESIAFKSSERKLTQMLLQELHALSHVNIVCLCDVSPLFRLCHQNAYPDVPENEYADVNEVLVWSTMLADYSKLYDWKPPVKSRLDVNASALDVLTYESKGWNQLQNIKALFHSIYEKQLAHIETHWTHEQIIDFFSSHAGAIYQQKWAQCTLDERILLYQLAMGATLNPNSKVTLEQLLRRGYIYRDCGWFIINESFRRYVLNAESEERFAQWLAQVSVSSWQYVRIPAIVSVIVLAVMIVVSTGQSLQSVIAAVTASLGLVPSLMRNLSFFRGTPTVPSD